MAIKRYSDLQLEFDLDLDDALDDAQERKITDQEARQISEAARSVWEERGRSVGEPEWFQDYRKLIEQGWPWRVACYIAWAASPRQLRRPDTIQNLAQEVLGLKSPRVIYVWRKKYPSIDTIVAMMQAAPLFEHRRDVLQALADMASRPDYKSFNDRKLFLEMIGDYTPKSQLELGKSGKSDGIKGLSDEELDALLGSQQPAISDQQDEEEDDDPARAGADPAG